MPVKIAQVLCLIAKVFFYASVTDHADQSMFRHLPVLQTYRITAVPTSVRVTDVLLISVPDLPVLQTYLLIAVLVSLSVPVLLSLRREAAILTAPDQICPCPSSLAQSCRFFAAKKAYAKPPPSTTRTEPVTHADIPLARNSTALAIS